MTDKQIQDLTENLTAYVQDLLSEGYNPERGEITPAPVEPHEAEYVVTEVQTAFLRACYLVEFKRLRAGGNVAGGER